MNGRMRAAGVAVGLAVLALVGLGWAVRAAEAAGPWYVKPGGSDGADCLDPATACATIQAAVDKASAGDTIFVATGVYTAAAGTEVVSITQEVTLSGGWDSGFTTQGGLSTVDGSDARRGFRITHGATATVDHFLVQNGNPLGDSGGGFWISGTLTLNHSLVTGNQGSWGGGIYLRQGNLTITNTTIAGNVAVGGNGVMVYTGTASISASDIRGNTTVADGYGLGGGLWMVNGSVTLNDSAVTGNNIHNGCYGGGLAQQGGLLTLNNTTVSGNSGCLGGGISTSGGVLVLNSSTVSGNRLGGGLYRSPVTDNATLRNTLVAGNEGGDCSGEVASLGYNLIGTTAGCIFASTTGDLVNVDAKLGVLVGAPGYVPLAPDSPAVNAGHPGGCAGSLGPLPADQRGQARVGVCDIGAYEYTVPGPAVEFLLAGGSPQKTTPGTLFDEPLAAIALDAVGSPVSGTLVTWTGPAAGAGVVFSSSGTYTRSALTTFAGLAASGPASANAIPGAYTVTAAASGVVTTLTYQLSNFAIYVKTGGSDADDCLTPATACASLNGALAKADDGDEIRVASGIYPSGQVVVAESVILLGGWNAGFTAQTGLSTLAGESLLFNTGYYTGNQVLDVMMVRFRVQNTYYGIVNSGRLDLRESVIDQVSGTALSTWSTNGHLKVSNTTINNQGFGVVVEASASAELSNVTLGGPGTSVYVYAGGSLLMRNTLAHTCGGSGSVQSGGYNLLVDASGCSFSPAWGDQVGVDPKLWPAVVEPEGARPLMAGSPAINGGNPDGCRDHTGALLTTDQRGAARDGVCDIGAYEANPANSLIRTVFLPAMRRACGPGICGRVRLDGAPAAGVGLELRFFNGSSWSTRATTTTDADGWYAFAGQPGLAPGQFYYVLYRNQAQTPGRLWLWGAKTLTQYAEWTTVYGGDFDIAGIALGQPADGAEVALPYTFTWTPRPATPGDSYEFNLFDPFTNDPYFYTNPPLGYVGGYTLNTLPSGFSTDGLYVWDVWVYDGLGGFGISLDVRVVFFSNAGAAAGGAAADLALADRLAAAEARRQP